METLPDIDMLTLMTVNPGFGGQEFMESVVPKIERARQAAVEKGLELEIEVDGGIKKNNAGIPAAAGANVLVAGSAVFTGSGSVAENIAEIRRAANAENGH